MLAFLMSPRKDLEQLLPNRDWFTFVTNLSSILQLLACGDRYGKYLLMVLMDPPGGAETFF